MKESPAVTKIAVGMSGGVDSSVTAALLTEQGYHVTGVTLRLWDRENTDAADAASIAASIGIPHEVWDLRREFYEAVILPFGQAYRAGQTPNPCVFCNRFLKFGAMLDMALDRGFDGIATGHYARIEQQPDGHRRLKKAVDSQKEQTYVLYSLTQRQLSHTLFPLGGYRKEEIRAYAEQHGFATAHKADSQDICFVPDGDYVGFLNRTLGIVPVPGDFLDTQGRVIGTHRGVEAYTIGQRKGLGVAFGEPRFVIDKDAAHNAVILGTNEQTFSAGLIASQLNWIENEPTAPFRTHARTRYNQIEQPATVTPLDDGRVRVVFDVPHRAITPGQAVVFYEGDTVIGGGTIEQKL